jgi:hypothetical protein
MCLSKQAIICSLVNSCEFIFLVFKEFFDHLTTTGRTPTCAKKLIL